MSRALRALSSSYVERRQTLAAGGALTGAGKRAAFALFYGPLHFLIVAHIVRSIPGAAADGPAALVDLGCGAGAAGAAWARACERPPRIVGVDRHPWALGEAARTYRVFGLDARTAKSDVASFALPRQPARVVASFTLNELRDPSSREALLTRLLDRAGRGDRVLIVEPLAGFVAPWWSAWRTRVLAAGGRADEWRVRADLPPIVERLDRAAGLNHRELTARTLWL